MPDRRAEPPAVGTGPSVRGFVLRFLVVFAGLEALVYLVLWQDRWFAPYATVNARATALLLAPFLDGVAATGGLLTSPGFSVQVRPGCDAYQAGAVLLAGVLAFPATTVQRLWGAAVGLASLQLLNLLRLGVLLLAGQRDHALFERMHLQILPLLFVAAALALLFGWCLWTRRRA